MAGLFFFNDTSTTEIYTFSLHDALPIYRELMDTQHFYGFIVVDHLGRAYHPILGGDIARYDPRTEIGRSTRLNSSHANISYAVFCLKKTTTIYASPTIPHYSATVRAKHQ